MSTGGKRNLVESNNNQVRNADQNDMDSLKLDSMSHSFSSMYEFKSQKKSFKSKNVEQLANLSNDRRSLYSTPLIEFDTLG